MQRISRLAVGALASVVLVLVSTSAAQDNLVANGSFVLDADGNREPDSWTTSGVAEMKQTLTIDAGPDETKAGKLVCNKFVGGSPASHAMVCQSGHVAIKAGQWYLMFAVATR